ncbi:MAG: hypothetical protein H6983_11890 [Ectothiorhodospiraceae bacterium]|nr:hypothetical protein [Chromatiales bacterium]MCP5154861.1 hypothetical protein [Ectothiorhodospiraceae bacterium]
MKLKRLLARLEEFLNARERDRRAEKAEIRKVLKRLKRKEHKLRAEAEAESDAEARSGLESRIAVAHAQRRKGLAALKALKRKD